VLFGLVIKHKETQTSSDKRSSRRRVRRIWQGFAADAVCLSTRGRPARRRRATGTFHRDCTRRCSIMAFRLLPVLAQCGLLDPILAGRAQSALQFAFGQPELAEDLAIVFA
jgi:hypothetical protein